MPLKDTEMTDAERDSLFGKAEVYLFPLFGERVVRRGYELPYPFGVTLNGSLSNTEMRILTGN